MSINGGKPWGSLHVATGTGAQAYCDTFPDRPPILHLAFGEMAMTVNVNHSCEVTAEDIAFARDLIENATTYLAECERIHATQADDAA